MTRGFPVKARAKRSAIIVASVPEDVNRTFSAEGIRRRTSRAQSCSSSWLTPRCVPLAACCATAETMSGCE